MKEQDEQKKIRLCFGSILFGVILTICVFVIIHYGSHIEFTREHSSLLKDIILWLVEWVIILVNIAIPWIVWKKLVKPYL
ncbi:MAG: hypothetical protein PF551_03930 [Candidatus Marinimicrobia bacterium]|jgi:hypothetical protein|nr:hypothetical protein [Candidatus Neomarinimicrobiota bacterium]